MLSIKSALTRRLPKDVERGKKNCDQKDDFVVFHKFTES
jgi:hypothetical protein